MRALRALPLLGILVAVAGSESFEIRFGEGEPRRRELGGSATLWLVVAPVSDLRRDRVPFEAGAAGRRPYPADPLQETQVLFGEPLEVFEESKGWLRVEAPALPQTEGRSRGSPGWVLAADAIPWPQDYLTNAVVIAGDAPLRNVGDPRGAALRLPMGSRVSVLYVRGRTAAVIGPRGQAGNMRSSDIRLDRLAPTTEEDRRGAVIEAARRFLGARYLRGGRTGSRPWDKRRPSGIDAPGLVQVAHAAAGLRVPRDVRGQFAAAQPLASGDLRPGDLVFLAKAEEPERIVHVMIFEGGERLIDADPERGRIRRVTFKSKLGRGREEITPKSALKGYLVHPGRLTRVTPIR